MENNRMKWGWVGWWCRLSRKWQMPIQVTQSWRQHRWLCQPKDILYKHLPHNSKQLCKQAKEWDNLHCWKCRDVIGSGKSAKMVKTENLWICWCLSILKWLSSCFTRFTSANYRIPSLYWMCLQYPDALYKSYLMSLTLYPYLLLVYSNESMPLVLITWPSTPWW